MRRNKAFIFIAILGAVLSWYFYGQWVFSSATQARDARNSANAAATKPPTRPVEYRINYPDVGSLQAAFDRIANTSGVIVVCLGDSQMYGTGVSAAQTVPAYLDRCLRVLYPGQKITVFNLAVSGLKPAEAYFLVHKLAGMRVSLLIYNVNSGWFTYQKAVEYGAVIKATHGEALAARWDIHPEPASSAAAGKTPAQNTAPKTPATKVSAQKVSAQKAATQKTTTQKAATQNTPATATGAQKKKSTGLENWRTKPELLPAGPRAKLMPIPFTKANLHWQLYLEMLKEWRQTGRPALVYLTPANWELLDLKYQIDHVRLRADQARLLQAARDAGACTVDYAYLIDSSLYADQVHLLPEGNRQLAQKLALDLAAWPPAKRLLSGRNR